MIAVVVELGRVDVHWAQTLNTLTKRLYGTTVDVRYMGQRLDGTHVHRVVGQWNSRVRVEVARIYLPGREELEAVVEDVVARTKVTEVTRHDLVRAEAARARVARMREKRERAACHQGLRPAESAVRERGAEQGSGGEVARDQGRRAHVGAVRHH